MANRPFTQGVHDLGQGAYAYLQPDGTWGWSNAGLVESRGETLLVDTLMSVPLTRDMLAALRAKVPAAERIGTVVNTHANPDHFFGNQLVAEAEIVATVEAAKEIAAFDPMLLVGLNANWEKLGDAGAFFREAMGRKFDFTGITVTPPNRTFHDRLTLQIGDKTVHLADLGPAHTASDTIVHVPADRIVFTGDILFNEAHPIMWAGPVGNWIAACDHILALDIDTVVPGHGPITDKAAVQTLRGYFTDIEAQAWDRFRAGQGWEEAANELDLEPYAHWTDSERIVGNVYGLYRGFGAALPPADALTLFAAMGRYRRARKR